MTATDEATTEQPKWQANQNRHTRFRTIVGVLRKYNVLSNLARQKIRTRCGRPLKCWGQRLLKLVKFCRHERTL